MGSIVGKLRAPDKVCFCGFLGFFFFSNHIVLIFFNFSMKNAVVGTHLMNLTEAFLMSTNMNKNCGEYW